MTAAEHRAIAEALCVEANAAGANIGSVEYEKRCGHRLADTIALAQVHATLATIPDGAE